MSNAQQIEHRPGQQQDAAAQTTQSSEPSLELRPDLKDALVRMNPADARPLAEMLKLYPSLSNEILSFAASHLGNAFVQRAIAIAQGSKAQGRGGAMSQDEMHGFLDDAPAKAPPAAAPHKPALSQAELHEYLDDAPAKAQPAQPAAAAEPAWVAGARAFNAAHTDWVDEFNDLTANVARLDGVGKVDPEAVARWQSHHGLAPDGKIGPHTVAKARALKARPSAVAAGPQADARPPV